MAPLWPRRSKGGPVSGGSNLQEQSEGRGQANAQRDSNAKKMEQIIKAFECVTQGLKKFKKMYTDYKEKRKNK